VLVHAGELEQLEHLCRYIARPPIATQRLVLAPDGRVIYGPHQLAHANSSTSPEPAPFTTPSPLLARNPRR
jgi:hypothetical protein